MTVWHYYIEIEREEKNERKKMHYDFLPKIQDVKLLNFLWLF